MVQKAVAGMAALVKFLTPILSRILQPEVVAKDMITWEFRDITLKDGKGNLIFQQTGVRVPKSWSNDALRIVCTRYFYGEVGAKDRDTGIDTLVERVCAQYAKWAVEKEYLDAATAAHLHQALALLCYQQVFAWNSPVWFNAGIVKEDPQLAACFIFNVEDTLEGSPWSILNEVVNEGHVYRNGSGVGTAMETLRSSFETIRGGGKASGPISFMRGYGAMAGVIKSGGRTRRAAIMRTLGDWHLDLWHGKWDGEDFISAKANEEDTARCLLANGWPRQMDALTFRNLPLQSANVSVRTSDKFMQAVEDDTDWVLRGTTQTGILRTFKARDIFKGICRGTWECGDPGMQFDDTIHYWHTCKNDGRQRSSNPCSEYLWLNNTACNLASLNLLWFWDGQRFNIEYFEAVVELVMFTLDLNVEVSGYPNKDVTDTTRCYRTTGLGYGNLGALLMQMGLAYDSKDGRAVASSITSLMTAVAYRTSARLAEALGAFPQYAANEERMLDVMLRHKSAHYAHHVEYFGLEEDVAVQATDVWDDVIRLGREHGFRNAQTTLLAPVGTIGWMMDMASKGVEPVDCLKTYKELSGGGLLITACSSVKPALIALGYTEAQCVQAEAYISEHGALDGFVKAEHLSVFETAIPPTGCRYIWPEGHVKMLAAVQPFLSGGISKTINCPNETTAEQIGELYFLAWKLGVKCVAIYRDGSKAIQAIGSVSSTKKPAEAKPEQSVPKIEVPALVKVSAPLPIALRPLPPERAAFCHKIALGTAEGYLHVSYEKLASGELEPLELFIRMAKAGDAINGAYEAWATAISIGLRHGVPLDAYISKFKGMEFRPAGLTGETGAGFCEIAKSVPDFVARYLEWRFRRKSQMETASFDQAVLAALLNGNGNGPSTKTPTAPIPAPALGEQAKASMARHGYVSLLDCPTCQTPARYLGGTCHQCPSCGWQSGSCGA